MDDSELIEQITKGLLEGKQPHVLQAEAMQDGRWSHDEVSKAISQAILSVDAPIAIQVKEEMVVAQPKQNWFKRHKFLVGFTVLTGFFVAGGLYAATYFMSPDINEVGKMVVDKLVKIETVEYTGSIEGEITTDAFVTLNNIMRYGIRSSYPENPKIAGSKNTKIRLDFTGASDVRDTENPKVDLSFTITAEGFVIGVETKVIGEDLYFKITQFPNLGMVGIEKYLNQWYLVDYGKFQQLGDSGFPELEKIQQQKLTKEQKDRLVTVVSESKIFQIVEKLDSENMDGKDTYHYRYSADEVALLGTIQQIFQVLFGIEPDEIPVTYQEEFYDWLDIEGGEVWVAKSDFAPVRLTFDMSMRSVNQAPVSGRLSLDLHLKSYNQGIQILAPESSKSLFDEIEGAVSDSETMSRDSLRIAQVRQVPFLPL
ncbi:MAG: hypothetical protein KW793_02570, partial [Candidatus Doudnabacteria bacterium]|nr:hypothetical protein [Candidatus Doudnabacteria bacterium]